MSKILVVDDDEDICENLKIRFQANKFDVIAVNNGKDAVQAVLKEMPDLVLLDIMMPGMDGYETCKQIKKNTASRFLPVIMLTALRRPEEKVKGLKVGADDFISKPFDDKELLARVNAFLRIKSLHDKLDESYQELKKLEALKDNLTELIVHDLRSPVSSIMATLEIFQGKHKDLMNPQVENFIAKIKRNCQVQINLINDILEISRIEEKTLKLEKRDISVNTLIDSCMLQVETSASQKNITIEKKLDDNLPSLCADETYLQRIITNLLNNSLKYTEHGGKMCLSVHHTKEEKSRFVFCIEDTGLGIAKEHLNKIFDRYFQVDRTAGYSRRGVGLGLSFCRMAVEAHGGTIWAESEKRKGSRFYFTIPDVQYNG